MFPFTRADLLMLFAIAMPFSHHNYRKDRPLTQEDDEQARKLALFDTAEKAGEGD